MSNSPKETNVEAFIASKMLEPNNRIICFTLQPFTSNSLILNVGRILHASESHILITKQTNDELFLSNGSILATDSEELIPKLIVIDKRLWCYKHKDFVWSKICPLLGVCNIEFFFFDATMKLSEITIDEALREFKAELSFLD